MKITKSQIRKIIKEEVTRLSLQVDAPKPPQMGFNDVMNGMPQKTEEEFSAAGYNGPTDYEDYVNGYEQGIHEKGFYESKDPNLVREMNSDGTISADEDEARYDLLAMAEEQIDTLIQTVKAEAERIGGRFRSPGIKREVFQLLAEKIHKAR
jgi:hypothetical protein